MLNRGLEPLLSPSSGMHSVLNPVEPPRLDNDLNALIAGYILSVVQQLLYLKALHLDRRLIRRKTIVLTTAPRK